MAFSKAKILRFNDIKSCAPPPGAYDPKFDEHVPGSVIYIKDKEKNAELRSPSSSSVSDTKSLHSCSTTNFRTPTVPRRRKIIVSNSAGKKTAKIFSPQKSEALREKIVECVNKDETIKDLESQVEELKLEISKIKVEKESLFEQKNDAETKLKQLENELEDVNKRLMECNQEKSTMTNEYYNLKTEHTAHIKELVHNMNELQERLKINKDETELFIKEKDDRLAVKEKQCSYLEDELSKLQFELDELKYRYEESLQIQIDLQKSHAEVIDRLNKIHQTEVEDMEYEMLKVVTDWRKTIECIEKDNAKQIGENKLYYEEFVNKMKADTDAQIRQSEENCSEKILLAEIQLEENCKDLERNWKLKLEEHERKSDEILKECQTISEYNIIQCEVEKKEIKQKLMETEIVVVKLQKENLNLTTENNELKIDMSNFIIELNETREKLGKEIELRQKNLDAALAEKHRYEITLTKTYDTINALKNRLLHSDRDVEQLTEELEQLEVSKIQTESKCIEISEELHHVLEINEELKLDYNISLTNFEQDIRRVELELLKKIDDFKLKSETEVSKLLEIIAEKQRTLNELNAFVKDQQKHYIEAQALIANAHNEIERLEADVAEYKFKVVRLESTINQSKKDFNCQNETVQKKDETIEELQQIVKQRDTELNEMASIYKKYIEKSKQYDNLQHNYEELVKQCKLLEKIITEQNSLIGPFREQLENYEKEHQLLVAHKDEATKEAKEMGLKYAEILGHQNYKQKLKHIVDLKKRNYELKESKQEYEAKFLHQNRTIEKLRQEISQLKSNRRQKTAPNVVNAPDKENICSPVRAQISSPGNPLKERN